ncbi:MAG TPA: hypothetical protein VKQ36_14430 [Ktedonobacterales bacterium]|nr:hypothetical protein [Ktedonobacterales bacterium]
MTERRTPGDNPERAREIVRPYAEAGLTWWLDYVGPAFGDGAAMRKRIEQGPLRLTPAP